MCAASLERVREELAIREHLGDGAAYLVPAFLLHPEGGTGLADAGNPYSFYLSLLGEITAPASARDSHDPGPPPDRPLIGEGDVVYLSFLRTGAALNGQIGTPLKQMAFLPHLLRLGVTVLLTLPTGRAGRTNRKGARGSPFAVADPFALDPSLVDPLIPGIDPATAYRALVEACGLAGIRCGSIVSAATLALDSPLIARFPEITYWWDLPPGTALRPAGAGGRRPGAPDDVTGIDPALAGRFADPPAAATVARVGRPDQVFWRSASGLTPATACPDVLGGDSGTYTWADVAGIRFGGDRVPGLGPAGPQAGAGDPGVQLAALAIAWRAACLGERLFWVDVAARVPPAVLELACAIHDAWDARTERLCEMLSADPVGAQPAINELLDDVARAAVPRQSARRLGFIAEELYSFRGASLLHDAVVGPWIYCVAPFTRDLDTLRGSIRHHLGLLAGGGAGRAFLAGLGDHDTCPPDPGLAAGLLVLSWLLPGGIPLLFGGHEHGAQLVVNKEFGFNTTPELRRWRARLGDDVLALFNDVPMPWQDLRPDHSLAPVARGVLRIRAALSAHSPTRLRVLDPPDSAGSVVGYRRATEDGEGVDVYLNTSASRGCDIKAPPGWRLVCEADGARLSPASGGRGWLQPFSAGVYASPGVAASLPGGLA